MLIDPDRPRYVVSAPIFISYSSKDRKIAETIAAPWRRGIAATAAGAGTMGALNQYLAQFPGGACAPQSQSSTAALGKKRPLRTCRRRAVVSTASPTRLH